MIDVEKYEPDYGDWHEFYTPISVCVGDLYTDGWFDLTEESWDFPKYSEEQHARLCEKILNHFWDRDIGVLPPGLWKRKFLEKLREIMPKYIPMYALLAEYPNLFNAGTEYYKARTIYSDFPQTQLGGNEDYASTGNDIEYEKIKQTSILELQDALKRYKDVDEMILDELEELFSCLISVSINGR